MARYIRPKNELIVRDKKLTKKQIKEAQKREKFLRKNRNDLIDRANENGAYIPLYLTVFVLPEERDFWVQLTPENLLVRKCAFWYFIPPGETYSNNDSKITIEIPKKNRITLSFYDEIFADFE